MPQRMYSNNSMTGGRRLNEARRRGVTAVELLILAGLIAMLAMVVVPRLTRRAPEDMRAELIGRLATLRNAIELYAAEHRGQFPSVEHFEQQLTGFTNREGDAQPTRDEKHIYGPYLDKIPELPFGQYKGKTAVVHNALARPGERPGGWFYNPDNGRIRANLPERAADPRGVPYNRY